MEALGERLSRNLEQLTNTLTIAALIIGGSLLLHAQLDGWLHLLGDAIVVSGAIGVLLTALGTVHSIGRGR
jgi:hypothetical protein